MATKTVTISPPLAANGGCTATCESYASGTTSGAGGTESWTNYKSTAAKSAEWEFSYWVYTVTYRYRDGRTSQEKVTRIDNPHPTSTRTDVNVFPYDATFSNPTAQAPLASVTFEVEAVFSLHPRDRLLVNTKNKVPGRNYLVHDPNSKKLVVSF